MEEETKLGNPALETAVATGDDPDLAQALRWSLAVNETVGAIVRGVPPFPFLRQCLEKLMGRSDMLVISATPNEALTREWEEHDIAQYVAAICGQETGTKKETLAVAAQYPENHVLMIGDAPGDYKAAVANNTLFYPINPGHDDVPRKRFHDEAFDRFTAGTYAGDYQQQLIDEFEAYLPEIPPWKRS